MACAPTRTGPLRARCSEPRMTRIRLANIATTVPMTDHDSRNCLASGRGWVAQCDTRLRRAKVINAMGEQQAAEKLVEAGRLLAQEPQAMQLRYFAALHDIAGERSSTVVFPLPIGLLDHLIPRSEST